MAMNRKPKPLRPNPLKATLKGESSTKPVVKVQLKKSPSKPAVKNPNAPKGTGSGATSGLVRVLTKSETAMKKGKVKPDKSNAKNATPPGRNRSMTPQEKYKPSTGNQRLIESTQQIAKKGYIGLTAAEKKAINPKGQKTSGMTPPKKTPPAPKPKGRGGRGFGGMGGGGLFGGRGLGQTR